MKKTMLGLLMGSAAISLIADDQTVNEVIPPVKSFLPAHHEIKPNLRILRHQETNYNYTKVIGGVEYKYFRPEGLGFGAFMGYSHSGDKSYFTADWDLKYTFNYSDTLDIYPIVGFSNTSHFVTNIEGSGYQVFCSKFNGGVGSAYRYNDLVTVDFGLHYFKDLSSSAVLYKGNDFWGKRYSTPYGLKATLDLIFPNIMSKDIVVGGFYAQTIKDCYKEYGFNASVVFVF